MNIEELLAKGNYHLIDVREEIELAMDGSISSALHIPLGEIPDRIDEIKSLEGSILVFCRSGNRSGKAVEILENKGLTSLYNVGGYKDLKHFVD